jgi:hypothetical protein
VKLTSDFANTSETIRIGDCFSFDSFAKNSSACNFRLLQQYRPVPDTSYRGYQTGHLRSAAWGRFAASLAARPPAESRAAYTQSLDIERVVPDIGLFQSDSVA